MDKSKMSIATITWARDAQEDKLLRGAMRCLAEEDVPVVIVDGGSGQKFINYLKTFPNFIVLKSNEPDLLAQVKLSLTTANNLCTRYVLYTESDKKLFFEHQLSKFITQAPDNDQVGVILPSRTLKSFSTFPEFQRYTETVANQLCAEIICQRGDFCYGPQLIHREIIPYLHLIKDDIGWGYRFYTLGIAHRLGYQIIQLALDLPCPPEQQEEYSKPERIYRMQQLVQNIQGMLSSQSASLIHSSKSKTHLMRFKYE